MTDDPTEEEAPGETFVEGRTGYEDGAVTTVFRDERGVLMICYEMPLPFVLHGVVIKSDS